jgi:RHS repeat-associated protein
MVGAATAGAEEPIRISHRPEGIKTFAIIADNFWGIPESEPEYEEPSGYYVEESGWGGDGGSEYREECERGTIFGECIGLHTSGGSYEGYLPRGFVKLEHLSVESDYWGVHSVNTYFFGWEPNLKENELFGTDNPGQPDRHGCFSGKPVNCATGNETQTQTDLSVGGRGPSLGLARTYNSRLAVKQSTPGQFGFGWTGSYSAHLELSMEGKEAIVYQDNGSTVTFVRSSPGEPWIAPLGLVQATLVDEGSGYVYALPDQTKLHFSSTGLLTSEVDRNGNALNMSRNSEGRLESVSDAAGRKIAFAYNSEGQVESAEDPMGHVAKYTYSSGNLMSVTIEGKVRWEYEYDASHELTKLTDGRKNSVTNEYDGSNRVIKQVEAGHERKWEYGSPAGTKTTITEPNGSTTVEYFNEAGEPTEVTRAHGEGGEVTTEYEYNNSYELTKLTDPNGHTTEYGYNETGDKTSETDPSGDERKWKYDGTHDIETETTPEGETTTIKRSGHGDPEVIERPIGSEVQKTKYTYDEKGDLTEVTDPLGNVTKYKYDEAGDKESEKDAEGDERKYKYNEDSQLIEETSPRGFVTKIERDEQGRPIKVTDPLGHTTEYKYDGNGNVEAETDGNKHTTKYEYNEENLRTKATEANGDIVETGYDAEGQMTSHTDGNKHVWEYKRNTLEQITEEKTPTGKLTKKKYEKAGRLKSLEDPEKHTTEYTYDNTGRLEKIKYSTGKPSEITYEYNKDSKVTKMTDETGETKNTWDKLDRLTEAKNGTGEVVKYEYNLINEPTAITYPNGKTVTREYDKANRLEKVTDWASNTTKFAYNADSQPTAIAFPSGTEDEDTYAYNEADQMTEVKMAKAATTLGKLNYTRDGDGQVKKTTTTVLPGPETSEAVYDENNRLTEAQSKANEYDAGNNPTKIEGTAGYTYNNADQLETGAGNTYTYNEDGQRIEIKPETGPTTTYGYNQAGNLISIERPKEGETAEIKDTYAYNGEGLRTSQTISGTTTYMAWDMAEELPLILSDGTNSYIYGPGGVPIEQINTSTGTVTYLHHDQQGSPRLLTGSTGTVTGKCSYSAYGTPTCEGTTTTPLGWDGQYTSSDTGLVYLRNRVYDPTTAQFLTVDPAVALTREPYAYGGDNPINRRDPDGLSAEGLEGVPCYFPFCGPPPPAVEGVQHGIETVEHGIESVWNAVNENGGPNDEGEAELKEKEAQRECGEPNRGSLEKLGKRETERILDEAGTDAHTDKGQTVGEGEAGHYDYYRDKSTGEIYLVPKSGGEPIPTGLGG